MGATAPLYFGKRALVLMISQAAALAWSVCAMTQYLLDFLKAGMAGRPNRSLPTLESLQYSDETDDPYNELSLGEKSFRENDFCLPRSIFGARLSHTGAQREAWHGFDGLFRHAARRMQARTRRARSGPAERAHQQVRPE